MLVWDDLNTHLTTGIRRYVAERDSYGPAQTIMTTAVKPPGNFT